ARWGDKTQTAKWGFDRLYFGAYPRVEASLTIDARQTKPISPMLMGIFYEDISDAADGGLYAELVENRDFEYSPTDRPEWKPESFWVLEGEGTAFTIATEAPIHPNNPHYAVLETETPGAVLGNFGRRDGIAVKRGDKYDLSFFGKTFSTATQDVRVELHDTVTKTTVAATTVAVSGADWRRFAAVLEPSADVRHGRIVVRPLQRGRVALDMISLFPQKTFKGRKNGLRPDLAQAIADLKPRFVRFPGGCIVHGSSLKEAYYWKTASVRWKRACRFAISGTTTRPAASATTNTSCSAKTSARSPCRSSHPVSRAATSPKAPRTPCRWRTWLRTRRTSSI
ncbi:MAG TPA: carbohydrate binding domain-containing protein, partial [Opitutaceae bacterium]